MTAEIKKAQKDYAQDLDSETTTVVYPEETNMPVSGEILEMTTALPDSLTRSKPDTILPKNVQTLIIFLTDGEPTIGETVPDRIFQNIRISNANLSIPIFSLAFGDGADFQFVRKISLQNSGFARKIYEASDAALQLKGFYNEIASPLLSNVTFNYTSPEYNVTDLTLTKFPTIFGGTEIAVAGVLVPVNVTEPEESTTIQPDVVEDDSKDSNSSSVNTLKPITHDRFIKVTIGGSGRDGFIDLGRPQVFSDSPIPWCIPSLRPYPPRPTAPPTPEDQFLEKLWAYLTIQQLIDQDIAAQVDSAPAAPEEVKNSNNELKNDTVVEETPKDQAKKLALKVRILFLSKLSIITKLNHFTKHQL